MSNRLFNAFSKAGANPNPLTSGIDFLIQLITNKPVKLSPGDIPLLDKIDFSDADAPNERKFSEEMKLLF